MSKLASRLGIFFIGLPIVVALVYINYMYHLPFQLIILSASLIGANEFYEMLSKKVQLFSKATILILCGIQPIIAYSLILAGLSLDILHWVYIIEIILLMGLSIFTKTFEGSISKIAHSALIIFYSGYMLTFFSRLTVLNESRYYLTLFFFLVFLCDSIAWLFGVCFGKNNRGIIPASPNKSVMGFIGGFIGAIAVGCLYKFVITKLNVENVLQGPYWKIIVLSLIVALAGIIGDLIESVMKRDCDVKDSGKVIPGRGGLLDSIDSLTIAVPVFYAGIHFLYGVN